MLGRGMMGVVRVDVNEEALRGRGPPCMRFRDRVSGTGVGGSSCAAVQVVKVREGDDSRRPYSACCGLRHAVVQHRRWGTASTATAEWWRQWWT